MTGPRDYLTLTDMARLSPEQRQRTGDAVANRRADLGLTQAELTERANVASDRVSIIERAEEWPQTRTRRAIEEALGWKAGAMIRIARGESDPEHEIADPLPQDIDRMYFSDEAIAAINALPLTDAEKQQLIARP